MTKVELSLFIEANYPLTDCRIARNPVHGVGVNDAQYVTKPTVSGEPLCDPAYAAWKYMLRRAYSSDIHDKFPTYIGVTVCDEWHYFSVFRKWWLSNYRDGWHLDKDMLSVGNREYGPRSCVYIPGWMNRFTTDSGASRGDNPIGVYHDKRRGNYQSRCSNPITGKYHLVGMFTTPEDAHEAWLNYKLELADQLKPDMDAIDKRIYHNVVKIIKAAR